MDLFKMANCGKILPVEPVLDIPVILCQCNIRLVQMKPVHDKEVEAVKNSSQGC
jgi:hypothetical protein